MKIKMHKQTAFHLTCLGILWTSASYCWAFEPGCYRATKSGESNTYHEIARAETEADRKLLFRGLDEIDVGIGIVESTNHNQTLSPVFFHPEQIQHWLKDQPHKDLLVVECAKEMAVTKLSRAKTLYALKPFLEGLNYKRVLLLNHDLASIWLLQDFVKTDEEFRTTAILEMQKRLPGQSPAFYEGMIRARALDSALELNARTPDEIDVGIGNWSEGSDHAAAVRPIYFQRAQLESFLKGEKYKGSLTVTFEKPLMGMGQSYVQQAIAAYKPFLLDLGYPRVQILGAHWNSTEFLWGNSKDADSAVPAVFPEGEKQN